MVDRDCPSCGRTIPAGRRFCGGCGRPVVAAAEPAPPEPAALSCEKCGTVYAPGKRFCKQCGHAVGTPAQTAAHAISSNAQDNLASSNVIPGQGSEPAATVIVVPPAPESEVQLCAKCGAVVVLGKRFCKLCGHAVGTPAPVPSIPVLPEIQAGPAPQQTSIPTVFIDHAVMPSPQPATQAPALSSPADPPPSTILPDPPSQSEPAKIPSEDLTPASPKAPSLISDEEEFQPLYKFSGDEQEPSAPTLLQADSSAHDRDSERFGRSESDDSHAGMFSSLQDSASTPRRTLVLPIGAVAVAALLGVGWFVVTHYHSSHPAAQVPTPATAPPTAPAPAAALPAEPAPQAAPATPVATPKPAPNKHQSAEHDAPLPRAVSKPGAADPQPKLQKHQEGNCALDSSMLPRMLDQADRNREQGNYADAARQYRSVLACDPKNPRAFNGLEVTLTDIQHQ